MYTHSKGIYTIKSNQIPFICEVRNSVRKTKAVFTNRPPDYISENGSNPSLSANPFTRLQVLGNAFRVNEFWRHFSIYYCTLPLGASKGSVSFSKKCSSSNKTWVWRYQFLLLNRLWKKIVTILIASLFFSTKTFATWSIIMIDERTNEIGIPGSSYTYNCYGIGKIIPNPGPLLSR